MKTLWSTIIFLLSVLLVGSYFFFKVPAKKEAQLVKTTAPANTTKEKPKEKEKEIDYAAVTQKLDQYLKDKQFNGSVLISYQGRTILDKGYGYADVQKQIENTSQTKYRIGSITKTTIAVSILQLQEQGKLNIQDNVHTYIPSFPVNKNITLYHLLTHTSGLPEHGKGKVNAASRLNLVTWLGQQPTAFQPGQGWLYTDYNYMLLAYILEKISGQSVAQYVKDHIFTPVGMTESGMGETREEDVTVAKGYKKKENELVLAPKLIMSWLYGCGEMYTTVHDMKKLDEAIMTGKLISSESLNLMFTPSPGRKYAFSFYIYPDYYHNHGVLSGWNTFNNFNRDKQLFVIEFSNVQNGINDDFNNEFRKLVSDLLEKEEMGR
ncbi:serine hydrolase [Bacillus cereus group sp. BfR-BA-01380]|uniref:serine hydrolase domain-containing protein n=1 Tax=Bacillus cereus group sp. BfR-BA-01380 TaxID=2920324 RepID=UPI001F58150D|nr:serine hydrolase domain-containing protein [Bacillus cereus group sp. BfR-BA-01380]